ncbi:MAG: hypothetical protein EA427_03240 [Spirochaetaceae bacterium]|nr:MAG: hypothetical protein EA427_03240 [Spirochaetaceae bacterium]
MCPGGPWRGGSSFSRRGTTTSTPRNCWGFPIRISPP